MFDLNVWFTTHVLLKYYILSLIYKNFMVYVSIKTNPKVQAT